MKTKSLSLLLILAICITIGGVYAAWIYAETPLSSVHGHIGSFGLSNASINNAKGTLSVNAEAAHLIIDMNKPDTPKAEDAYKAVLKATGDIVFVFTPSDAWLGSNAGVDSVLMEYYLVTTGSPDTFKINDGNGEKLLFTTFNTTDKIEVTLTKSGNVFTATVSAETLLPLIAINDFVLDAYEKYEAFSTTLGTFGNIGVALAEKNV